MDAALETPAPPDPPELPDGIQRRPAWPWWFALVGFLVGIAATLLLVAIFGGVLAAVTGAKSNSPGFIVLGTIVQGLAFGATALFFASRVARPKAWHFGLGRAQFWPTVGWATLGIGAFYVLTIIYGLLVKPSAEQNTVQELGGNSGTFGLIVAGVMVIAVAPVIEEFFFRGFFYRALRSRLSWIAAALVDGLLFGSIHYSGNGVDGLLILPPLAILGVIFCLVYERTGTLLAPIGMHALNNTIAFAAQAHGGWQVSVVVGPLMLGAVVLTGRRLAPAPRLSSA